VRFLLDTHTFLWLQTDVERLPSGLLSELERADQLILSAASGWEIAIKQQLGKLPLPEPASTYVPTRMRQSGIDALPIEMSHALAAGELPIHHRDPFDRVLVAQAVLLDLPLVSTDTQLDAYGVERRWG